MQNVAQSTIAQAVYANPQDCNFVRVVTELETMLSRSRRDMLRTRWDYEDVVIFDVGDMRIVLAWSEDVTDDMPACLLMSVGPVPGGTDRADDPEHAVMCSRLLERIQHRYPPDAVLWRQLPLAIEADLVDALIDCLPTMRDVLGYGQQEAADDASDPPAALPAPDAELVLSSAAANDRPDLPRRRDEDLARIRAALYPEPEALPSETAQMRLAAQAMNATLIVVFMPLGVAAMTYSLMKGENIGFSARMMAVTGTLLGLSQTPLAQQITTFSGV